MIKVRDIHKSFEGTEVLKGINLEINNNETIFILGPSGQGKTVFIKTLVRLILPDSGSIFYDDIDIFKLTKKQFSSIQQKIAFVFQNSALFDFINVYDNLSLYLKMHRKMSDTAIRDKVMNALQFVSLEEEVLDKFPEELSGGMRKRVAIARALIKEPEYIFYDEPTTGLDKGNALKVSELINRVKKEISATSVVVTHDTKLMHAIADRVALLKDGSILFVGRKDEISDKSLKKLYNTEDIYE